MKKISPKIGLFIVFPVIIGMLITGIVMWPEGQGFNSGFQKKTEKLDSLKEDHNSNISKK